MIADENTRVMVTLPKTSAKEALALAEPLKRWRGNRAFSWMVNDALKHYGETMDTSSGHPRPRRDPAQLDIQDAIASTPSLPERIREIARELDANSPDFRSLAMHLADVAERIEAEAHSPQCNTSRSQVVAPKRRLPRNAFNTDRIGSRYDVDHDTERSLGRSPKP